MRHIPHPFAQDADAASRWYVIARLLGTLAVIPCLGVTLDAQDSTTAVKQRPNTQEFGIDAGMLVGLGSESSFQLTLPAERARVGFFLNNDTRWSIEPAAGLSYVVTKDSRGELTYDVEVGGLYHFQPPSNVTQGLNAVGYVRPFIGVNGVAGGGGSNADFSMGAGLGIEKPWRQSLAFRFEANAGYGFHNQAFRLGAFVGVSVFTHRRIG